MPAASLVWELLCCSSYWLHLSSWSLEKARKTKQKHSTIEVGKPHSDHLVQPSLNGTMQLSIKNLHNTKQSYWKTDWPAVTSWCWSPHMHLQNSSTLSALCFVGQGRVTNTQNCNKKVRTCLGMSCSPRMTLKHHFPVQQCTGISTSGSACN